MRIRILAGVPLILAIVAMSTRASEPCCTSGAGGSGWSYYGLPGGPAVTYPNLKYGTPLPAWWTGPRCSSGIAIYDPPKPNLGPAVGAFGHTRPDQPRYLLLGWPTYRTPSPRVGNLRSVDVRP